MIKTLPLLLIASLFISATAFKDGLTADQILKKAEAKLLASTMVAEMDISVKRPRYTKSMSLKTWTKGSDYAMAYVTGPEKDKGTVYLKAKTDVYSYLPKVNKTIKIPSTLLSQSWMGTDLSTDDLVKLSKLTSDYTASLAGSEYVSGLLCHKIVLTPKAEADVLWGRLELFIDKIDYIQMKTIFYDEDEEVVNTLVGSNVKTLGGKKLASKYVMTPAGKSGQSSTIIYRSIKFNSPIATAFFTKSNLPKVKP